MTMRDDEFYDYDENQAAPSKKATGNGVAPAPTDLPLTDAGHGKEPGGIGRAPNGDGGKRLVVGHDVGGDAVGAGALAALTDAGHDIAPAESFLVGRPLQWSWKPGAGATKFSMARTG